MDALGWGALLLLAAAVGAVALRWHRRDAPGGAPLRSAWRRGLSLGGLGLSSAARAGYARARSWRASDAERRRALDEAHAANARRVLETMGQLKGAAMKLAQMAGYVTDDVPEAFRSSLAQLQSAAPPVGFDALRIELERELDAPLGERFASVDPEPLASASIGQVHRGVLPDGRAVAIKIQYPGVDEAIAADLANVGWLSSLVGAMYPNLEPGPIVRELRERLGEELDYVLEARNLRNFGELYAGHPWIVIPGVHDALSTRRVLTMDLVDGADFEALLQADEATRQRAAEILYRFVWGSMFRHRAFNGDPHPGNYRFGADGRVAFLDFGCVKYFGEATARGMTRVHEHHLAGELDAFRATLVELGFIERDAPVSAELYSEYMSYFYRPFLRDEVFTFDREYTSRSLAHVLDRGDERYGAVPRNSNMPADMVFLNRLQWGLWPLLAQLGARANWHRIHREYILDEPASTALGREAEVWAEAWRRARGIPLQDEVWLEPDGIHHAPHKPQGSPA